MAGGNDSLGLFRLPADMRPPRPLGIPVVTGNTAGGGAGGTALLYIYPSGSSGSDGYVLTFQPTAPAQQVVHLGEIVFRTDA